MSDEKKAKTPRFDPGGIPRCTSQCPSHDPGVDVCAGCIPVAVCHVDGRPKQITGTICEPALRGMAKRLAEVEETLTVIVHRAAGQANFHKGCMSLLGKHLGTPDLEPTLVHAIDDLEEIGKTKTLEDLTCCECGILCKDLVDLLCPECKLPETLEADDG